MKITYDREANAGYIYVTDEITPGGVKRSYHCDADEVGGMIALDFDAEGKLLGIEVIDATSLLPKDALDRAEIIDHATLKITIYVDLYGLESGDLGAVRIEVAKALGVKFVTQDHHVIAQTHMGHRRVETIRVFRNRYRLSGERYTDDLPKKGVLIAVQGTERPAEIEKALMSALPGLRLLRRKEFERWV